MARRIEIKVPHLPATRTLFTVTDTPIGAGKNVTNKRRADVELVQFFLAQFFAKNPKLFRQLPPTKSGRFLIDGNCGAQTKAGIWVFQTDASRRGNGIYPDGVVDVPSTFLTPSGRSSYTILALNDWFIDNGTGAEHFSKLENHPDLARATALRTELSAKAAA
jgi:hypothetical protein